jgi:hypothetical protein
MTPTREQIETARNLLVAGGAAAELASLMGPGMSNALDILLAATAQPTEEELVEEVRAVDIADPVTLWDVGYARGYIAGALREGRR